MGLQSDEKIKLDEYMENVDKWKYSKKLGILGNYWYDIYSERREDDSLDHVGTTHTEERARLICVAPKMFELFTFLLQNPDHLSLTLQRTVPKLIMEIIGEKETEGE